MLQLGVVGCDFHHQLLELFKYPGVWLRVLGGRSLGFLRASVLDDLLFLLRESFQFFDFFEVLLYSLFLLAEFLGNLRYFRVLLHFFLLQCFVPLTQQIHFRQHLFVLLLALAEKELGFSLNSLWILCPVELLPTRLQLIILLLKALALLNESLVLLDITIQHLLLELPFLVLFLLVLELLNGVFQSPYLDVFL